MRPTETAVGPGQQQQQLLVAALQQLHSSNKDDGQRVQVQTVRQWVWEHILLSCRIWTHARQHALAAAVYWCSN
jgi:hypothetical protein